MIREKFLIFGHSAAYLDGFTYSVNDMKGGGITGV